jgi:hypothetical protein
MVEVLVSALLIFMAMGGILAMNTRSIHLLRSTRQAVASTQMLQERIESMRNRPWPEISSATALAAVLRVPTESERELADPNYSEFVAVSVPDAFGGESPAAGSFSLQRHAGVVTISADADLGAEPMLLVNFSLQWRDVKGVQQRMVRTVLARTGLTRSGVFGSTLGRPPTTVPPPAVP